MIKVKLLLPAGLLLLFSISCTAHQNWELIESAGFRGNEKLRFVPYDQNVSEEGDFFLYYFTTGSFDSKKKGTVLFCAGGPGQVVRVGETNFLDFLSTEYNVVYFHLRGSGVSQLPPSNRFDSFLRSRFAVDDIEKIRIELLGNKNWDAIVGYSYGSVLAQQYAAHLTYGAKVNKLVLVAPLSFNEFNSGNGAFEKLQTDMIKKQLATLKELYEPDDGFRNFNEDDKKRIFAEMEGKLDNKYKQIETLFESAQFVIDAFNDERLQQQLRNHGLSHDLSFFRAIREIRDTGWLVEMGKSQWDMEAIRIIILKELLKSETDTVQRYMQNKQTKPEAEWKKIVTAIEGFGKPQGQSSKRAYYVFSIYDGLHRGFLREWMVGDRPGFLTALHRSVGQINPRERINGFVEKIGLAPDNIKPWDPANSWHTIPTLIIKGEADPVTASGQAEYIYEQALGGFRALARLPGIGHDIGNFTSFTFKPPIDDSNELCRRAVVWPLRCLTSAFIQSSPKDFKAISDKLTTRDSEFKDWRSQSEVPGPKIKVFHCDSGDCKIND